MAKYNIEFKLKILDVILKENYSVNATANKFGLAESIVRKWFKQYESHGIDGLTNKNGTYDGNFKINVVEYMHNNHLSLHETAIKFKICSTSVLIKWERIYYEEGPYALLEERRGRLKNMSSKKGKNISSGENNKDLIEEIQMLRMENAYLKKLNALVQERVQRENPKKHKPSVN